jgi:ApaG protein
MPSPDFTIDTVRVSARSKYQPDYSSPKEQRYTFSYLVRIVNEGQEPVRLLRRHWMIISATGDVKEVEGAGIVGQTPTIMPGEFYEYTSWVQFDTPLGLMHGTYLMEQPATSPEEKAVYFRAEIPRFSHMAPELLN